MRTRGIPSLSFTSGEKRGGKYTRKEKRRKWRIARGLRGGRSLERSRDELHSRTRPPLHNPTPSLFGSILKGLNGVLAKRNLLNSLTSYKGCCHTSPCLLRPPWPHPPSTSSSPYTRLDIGQRALRWCRWEAGLSSGGHCFGLSYT